MKLNRAIAGLSAACLMLSGIGAAFAPLTVSAYTAAEAEEPEGVVNGLKYTTENGYGMITGYTDDMPADVVIPDEVGGKAVERIEIKAFYQCETLHSVVIPASAKDIGYGCFAGCTNLEKITFPAEIASFGQHAVEGTKWLADQQAKNPLVTAANVVVDGTGCKGAVTIPEGITIIGIQAFNGNENMTALTLPDTVKEIGSWAFEGCTGLKELTVPGSVEKFGWSCFEDCTGLESVTLQEGLKELEKDVFCGCSSMTSITFPSTMRVIDDAFNHCDALKEVTVPADTWFVDSKAFTDCANLESVTILGYYTNLSDMQWNTVAISNSGYWADRFQYTGKIRGYNGSLAQEYAEHFNVTFESLGEAPRSGICRNQLTWTLTEDGYLVVEGSGALEGFHGVSRTNGEITRWDYQGVAQWYMYRKEIRHIVFGPEITSFSTGAFSDCSALETVTILNPECERLFGIFWTSDGNYGEEERRFDGIIRGYAGSTAQSYAEKEGLRFEAIEDMPAVTTTAEPVATGVVDIATITEASATTNIAGVTTTAATSRTTNIVGVTTTAKTKGTTATTAKTPDSAEETGTTVVTTGTDVLTDDVLRGKCGETVSFSYHIVYEELAFDGEGDIADYDVSKGNPAPWYYEEGFGAFGNYSFPNTLRFGDGITGIGSDAFYGCDRVESIVVPEYISRIGANAFCGCTGLNRIEIRNPECKIADTDRTICSGIKDDRAYFNGTIAGYKGSTAQKYAQKYGYQFEELTAEPAQTTAVTRDEKQTTATTAATTRSTGITTTTAKTTGVTEMLPETTMTTVPSVTSAPDDTLRGKCGESATWAYNFILQHLEIEGSGDMADYDINDQETAPWFQFTFPETPYFSHEIRTIYIGDGITGIGDGAFFSCSSVENIVVPENIGRIGENAFYLCGALERIVILNPECKIADTEWTISSGIRANHAFFNGTIVGFEGSTAQEYAQKYGYRFEELTVDPESTAPVNGMQIALKLVPYLNTDGYTEAEQAEYQKQAEAFMKKVAKITVTGDLLRTDGSDPETAEFYYNATKTLTEDAAEIAALGAYDSAPLTCRVQAYWERLDANGTAEAAFEFLDASGNVLLNVNANPVAWVVRDGITTYYDKSMTVVDLSKALSEDRADFALALRVLKSKTVSGQYELADYDCETVLGDTDGSAEVSVSDAQLALKAYTEGIAGKDTGLTQAQVQAADIDRDGKISVEDAQLILKYYTEKNVAGKNVTWADLRKG